MPGMAESVGRRINVGMAHQRVESPKEKILAKHRFRVTVDALSEAAEQPLVFAFDSHDDLIALASRLGKTGDDDLLFFVGLKLFGEALLARKDDPLLKDFRPHFGELMKAIKGQRV
ncbi:MAG: hypothetical protein H6Q99_1685 [Proteobacteria bacterium]|nr:hypothetical protein [Pseudomonadota bacterium]